MDDDTSRSRAGHEGQSRVTTQKRLGTCEGRIAHHEMEEMPSVPVGQSVWPRDSEALMQDWLVTTVKEYPKRLGGWKILYCCPPRIWRTLAV